MKLKAGTKTVTTAGISEAIVSTRAQASAIIIRAMEDNAGPVYVGDNTECRR